MAAMIRAVFSVRAARRVFPEAGGQAEGLPDAHGDTRTAQHPLPTHQHLCAGNANRKDGDAGTVGDHSRPEVPLRLMRLAPLPGALREHDQRFAAGKNVVGPPQRLPVQLTAVNRKSTETGDEIAREGGPEQLLLGHEEGGPSQADPDNRRITQVKVVRRHQYTPGAGDILPAQDLKDA